MALEAVVVGDLLRVRPGEAVPVDGGRTLVEIAEEGWRFTEGGLKSSYGNCMGWAQMLAALKVWVERGINIREGMYK